MANYQVPEGFLYDKKSGLYYSITEAVDSTGKLSRVLTWFDAESGTYDQEVYPVIEQEGHLPGGVQKAGDFSESPKQPFDKHQLGILILSGSGILLLCAAILFLGLVKSGWFKNRSEEEISRENVDQADDIGTDTQSQMMTESLSETDASEQTPGEAETTEEELYSTIELVEDGADPDDPMNLMNITVPDFGTRDDLENTREWLHEQGIMGY